MIDYPVYLCSQNPCATVQNFAALHPLWAQGLAENVCFLPQAFPVTPTSGAKCISAAQAEENVACCGDTALDASLAWQSRTADVLPSQNVAGYVVTHVGYAQSSGPVFLCDECGSALDIARFLVEAGLLPLWGSVLAAKQTSGRGQLRRAWQSSVGNIHAVLRIPAKARYADSLASLVVGYCMAKAFEDVGCFLRIKWPNDLILDGKKVGGILLEERGDVLLAGIGINTLYAPEVTALRDGAVLPAGTLFGGAAKTLPSITPLLWLTLAERAFLAYSSTVTEMNENELRIAIENKLLWLGEKILVLGEQKTALQGLFMGLAPDGAVRVNISGREHIVSSCTVAPL